MPALCSAIVGNLQYFTLYTASNFLTSGCTLQKTYSFKSFDIFVHVPGHVPGSFRKVADLLDLRNERNGSRHEKADESVGTDVISRIIQTERDYQELKRVSASISSSEHLIFLFRFQDLAD